MELTCREAHLWVLWVVAHGAHLLVGPNNITQLPCHAFGSTCCGCSSSCSKRRSINKKIGSLKASLTNRTLYQSHPPIYEELLNYITFSPGSNTMCTRNTKTKKVPWLRQHTVSCSFHSHITKSANTAVSFIHPSNQTGSPWLACCAGMYARFS